MKLFLLLTISFVLSTIIGTLTHESGHYLMAKMRGRAAQIHYASTSFPDRESLPPAQQDREAILTLLGGPLQTMLFGTAGLAILILRRKSYRQATTLVSWQWLPVFLALFWLRQVLNFTLLLVEYAVDGNYSVRSDEVRLARYWNLPALSISGISAFAGACVAAMVVVWFVPRSQRLMFIIAGLVGGGLGYWLWLVRFGPVLMP